MKLLVDLIGQKIFEKVIKTINRKHTSDNITKQHKQMSISSRMKCKCNNRVNMYHIMRNDQMFVTTPYRKT